MEEFSEKLSLKQSVCNATVLLIAAKLAKKGYNTDYTD